MLSEQGSLWATLVILLVATLSSKYFEANI